MVSVDALQSSDLVDPLVGYSSFSFNSSSLFRPLGNPNFDSLASNLKHMVVRNPDSLLSQAKVIKDGSKDLLESDATMAVSEDKNKAAFTVHDKHPKERRRGLGLKRAKFTVKPMPSQPDMSLEPSISIDKLSDPEEFFAAFERMEDAKKELRRQSGQPLEEMDLNHASLLPRRRRPSLSGKSATYKHRTYSLTGIPDDNESFISSQRASDHTIMSPTREDVIPETDAMISSTKTRVSDVTQAMSSKFSELDELLSYDYEGLDEDGVQMILQDKLNIKLVDIGEPSLTNMPYVRREAVPNMKDSIFHVNDSSKAASSRPFNFSFQLRKTSNNQVSLSLCKSPLTSIWTPNKHVDTDTSQEVISYPEAQNRKQADQIGKRINSHEFSRFPVNEEVLNEAATSPAGLAGNGRIPNIESEELLNEISHSDNLVTTKDSPEFGRFSACGKEDIGVSGGRLPSVIAKDIALRDDSEEITVDIRQTAQTPRDDSFVGVDAATAHTEEDQTARPESIRKELFSEGSALEKASVDGGDGEMGQPLNTQGILIKNPNKKIVGSFKSRRKEIEESTTLSQENINVETVNKERKGKTRSNAAVLKEPKNKKRKVEGVQPLPTKVDEQLRRHSLFDAGTKWEAGVRRSTRIRMRPLEFWRGERCLLGRVHKSLVSVIGVKYASPTRNEEKPAVKVKSFVSDKYKQLLDLASSH